MPPYPAVASLTAKALTPAAGIALINGAQNFATWNVPNDGQLHSFNVGATKIVTVNETGGQITVQFTLNGTLRGVQLIPAGNTVGTSMGSAAGICDPNSQVVIAQGSVLTAGASTCAGVIQGQ